MYADAAKIALLHRRARRRRHVEVTRIMGMDPRIGPRFLGAGLGYGGYCLPKDIVTLERTAGRLGYDLGLLGGVVKINAEASEAVAHRIEEALWNLEGKKIALLGVAFKAGTRRRRRRGPRRWARLRRPARSGPGSGRGGADIVDSPSCRAPTTPTPPWWAPSAL